MAKRAETLETVLIALEVLRRIPRSRKVSAMEIQVQLANAGLKRDLRTVQRQLEMLTRHFDIERDDRSKPYGYRWKEQARGLSVPTLNERESLLLMLAESHLKNLLPASLMKSMDGFFAQARTNLGPMSTAKREREWISKVRVVSTSQPLLPPKTNPTVFEQVSNALYANCWLDVEYRNAAGVRTNATVMPLGLAQQGPRLYLVCRFEGYDNERSLALHRIQAARATTLPFDRPKDFDLRRYDNDGRFGFGDGRKVRLTFRITKDSGLHLLESPLSEDQTVAEERDHYKISATVIDSGQLTWWLRGFGDEITDIIRTKVRG